MVTYVYDAGNRPTSLTEGAGTTTFLHDANGNMTHNFPPNGAASIISYDANNRVAFVNNNTPIPSQDFFYTRDANGWVTQTERLSLEIIAFTRDALGRITKESGGLVADATDYTRDYTYDAERLAQDPAMRVIVGWQGTDKQAASTNTMSRFETEVLTEEENLDGLARLNAEWVDRAMAQTSHQRVILDMDSSESPVHGQQEGVAYNGHFESVCYHPLFLFNHFGDCEGAMLRPGNVHSAERWREVLEPVVKRY